jgi:hypothetical protein
VTYYHINSKISLNEVYLRFIEYETMIRGGFWVATFDNAIRNFNIANAKTNVQGNVQNHNFNSFILGHVRHKGFLLSRVFSFLVSPTYLVGCSAIHLENVRGITWSIILGLIRDALVVMDVMDLEWLWCILYGEGALSSDISIKIQSYPSHNLGLLYADVENITIINSDCFIARHAARLFHPKELAKKSHQWLFKKS